MSERWATIITNDDGDQVVSSIAQMEGVPPETRDDQKGRISVERVADGVLIGMIRGGTVDAVAGFGFPEGSGGANGRGVPASPMAARSNPDAKSRGAGTTSKAPASRPTATAKKGGKEPSGDAGKGDGEKIDA